MKWCISPTTNVPSGKFVLWLKQKGEKNYNRSEGQLWYAQSLSRLCIWLSRQDGDHTWLTILPTLFLSKKKKQWEIGRQVHNLVIFFFVVKNPLFLHQWKGLGFAKQPIYILSLPASPWNGLILKNWNTIFFFVLKM